MIETTLTGFDLSNLLEFFKNYKGFYDLIWCHEWILDSTSGANDYHRLYHFLYTNPMRRVKTIMTITVLLEFKSKSEVKLTIIVSGSKRGHDFGAQEICENKIFEALKQEPDTDLIIKELSQ